MSDESTEVTERQAKETRAMVTTACAHMAKRLVEEVEMSNSLNQARSTDHVDSIVGKWCIAADYDKDTKSVHISGQLHGEPESAEFGPITFVALIFGPTQMFNWNFPAAWLANL